VLLLALVLNIGQLVFFKYFDPFTWGLPIGISFYTFQALSYVIDVYRKGVSATHSLVDFGAYVTLFPQLVAGPIVKYTDVERELQERSSRASHVAEGIRRFCAGLCKKVILANPSGEMWESLLDDGSLFGTHLAILFFSLQIYFDFSGYSDMAIGLGRVLGFRFPENFNYPYISKSATEFWRRWHMTLSSYFREYVYIPLGGNRGGALRTYRNLLITWALTGLWHGASLNFLLWGLYFALVLIAEKAFLSALLKKLPDIISHLYAIFLIAVGWLIFSADGGPDIALRFFGVGCSSVFSSSFSYELMRNLLFLIIAVIGCTPLPRGLYLKIRERYALTDILFPLGGLLLALAYIVSSGYDPFLYFRF
jgi:alginate O-acetyltransferase complex protein AlgI